MDPGPGRIFATFPKAVEEAVETAKYVAAAAAATVDQPTSCILGACAWPGSGTLLKYPANSRAAFFKAKGAYFFPRASSTTCRTAVTTASGASPAMPWCASTITWLPRVDSCARLACNWWTQTS